MKSISELVIGKQWDIITQWLSRRSFNKKLSNRGQKRIIPTLIICLEQFFYDPFARFVLVPGCAGKTLKVRSLFFQHGELYEPSNQYPPISALAPESGSHHQPFRHAIRSVREPSTPVDTPAPAPHQNCRNSPARLPSHPRQSQTPSRDPDSSESPAAPASNSPRSQTPAS